MGDEPLHGVVDLDVAAPSVPREPSPQCAAMAVVIPMVVPRLETMVAQTGGAVLLVANDHARQVVMAAADLLPAGVHVPSCGWWPGSSGPALEATRTVERLTREATRGCEDVVEIVVATDASVGRQRPMAGCAWVREDLAAATQAWACGGDVLAAEMHAIAMALTAHRRAVVPVTVLSDCSAAVGLTRRALAGDICGATERVRREQRRIAATTMSGPVQVRWVRGHAEHPLNRMADRLAVLTRRDHEAGVAAADHTARARAAVLDGLVAQAS
jgi:ribonuclease HI